MKPDKQSDRPAKDIGVSCQEAVGRENKEEITFQWNPLRLMLWVAGSQER